MFQKISQRFKYDELLTDSECSEDYDTDMFFEGMELRSVPQTKDLVNQQKSMLLQRGETTQTAMRISQHPNQNIAMMDSAQQ